MGPTQEVAFKSQNKIFQRLAKISNMATLTPEERYSYDADVKNARDAFNRIRYAYDEGEAKGMAKGIAEGRHEAMMEAARNLKKMGISLDQIFAATGIPQDIILSL